MSLRPTPPTVHPQRGATTDGAPSAGRLSSASRQRHRRCTRWLQVRGRSLPLAAGLLAESTVWAILRRLRETPGAPILLIVRAAVSSPTATHRPPLTSPIPHQMTPALTREPLPRSAAWPVLGHLDRRIGQLPYAQIGAFFLSPGLAVCLPMLTHRPFLNWTPSLRCRWDLCFVVSGVVLRPGRM